MFIRPIHVTKNGKRHAYWALVESYRSERGPRQRVVSYLGGMDEQGRLGVHEAAEEKPRRRQGELFDRGEAEWVEVDAGRVRVENARGFGGPWLGLELMRRLGLSEFLEKTMERGKEDIPWPRMVQALVVGRLDEPSTELRVAEHLYRQSAWSDLLGVPSDKVNDDRLYRALDALLPHKEALEAFLKGRLGELFRVEYDLLLYDVTSTYFEGLAEGNALAHRGYSRDHRPDCKQVCLGLVVSLEGLPLGYEVFPGNRSDVKTLPGIVTTMEKRYGQANRIWVVDRGLVSEENLEFLRGGGRRYIVGTPRGMLRRFEQDLLKDDWQTVREGLNVKVCRSPEGKDEVFILCRSDERREKERAIHARFETRIEEGLKRIEAACGKRKEKVATIAQRVGRLLGQNSRGARLFHTEVTEGPGQRARLVWTKSEEGRDWATRSEGCYLLRTNLTDWSAQDLWNAYIQLTEAEAAFRVHKSDLDLRPIWHHIERRVRAHILVCFLAYVLWRTLGRLCRAAGIGDEPRRVFAELAKIQVVDVVLPTRTGLEIRKRCVTRPTEHQAILLERLGLHLPAHIRMTDV